MTAPSGYSRQPRSTTMTTPAAAMRTPKPIWTPETTPRGTMALTASTRRVAPRIITTPPTKMPAAAASPFVRPSVMATAAMVFMGCTGKGMSQVYAVTMLKIPIQNSAGPASTAPALAMPITKGTKVPRSPSMPDNSIQDSSEAKRLWRSESDSPPKTTIGRASTPLKGTALAASTSPFMAHRAARRGEAPAPPGRVGRAAKAPRS
mmetsp:Transcript_18582/g.62711  ORF Transcript_18582/g.62711 Transcript_18582/m.62711 type:complete len:206 (+) Transcript_18582:2225-2842(+)